MKLNNISFYGRPITRPVEKYAPKIVSVMQSTTKTPIVQSNNIASKGALSEFDLKNINDVKDLFEYVHYSIKSVAKAQGTRTSIRNGYSKLKKSIAGSRILEFSEIGKNGEDISINIRIDHGKTKKAILMIDDKQFVINPKGEIEKNPSMRFIREKEVRPKGTKIKYYTQKEIDDLDIREQIYALKDELKKFIDYISIRAKAIYAIRYQKAENTPGNILKHKRTLDIIEEKFRFFKSSINKLSRYSLDKDIFRICNKIKTFHAQNSILFKEATPDGRSLFLIYSKIKGKTAIKVLLMDYNNKDVDKSFVIYDNKLAKFHPKKANEKPSHLNYDFHYHTQEEIDHSGLGEYLNIINERLDILNANLRAGIAERLNK